MADINKTYGITITADDKASSVFKSLEKDIKGVEEQLRTIRNASAIVFAGLSASIGYFSKEAIEAQDSLHKAGSAVKIAGQDWSLYREQVEKTTASLQLHTRFSDDDFQRAFAQVVNITGDASKSLENLSLIADVATARNVDLATASDAVGKAMQGNIGRLGVLFPELQRSIEALGDTATDAQKAGVAIDYLSKKFKGLAEEDAKSLSGKLIILKNQFGELKEAIGGAFLSTISGNTKSITEVVQSTTEWVKENQSLIGVLGLTALAVTGFLTVVTSLGLLLPSFMAGMRALEIIILHLRVAFIDLQGTLTTFGGSLAGSVSGIIGIIAIFGYKIYEIIKIHRDLNEAIEHSAQSLDYLKKNFPIDTVEKYKLSMMTATERTREHIKAVEAQLVVYRGLSDLSKEWTPLLGTNEAAAQKYREELARVANETKRFNDEQKEALNLSDSEAQRIRLEELRRGQPSEREQVARLRGGGYEGLLPESEFRSFFDDILLPKAEELRNKFENLKPTLVSLSGAVGSGVGRVISSLTSMAKVAALSIRDVFKAIGEEILSLLARIVAQMIATGLARLFLGFITGGAGAAIPIGGGIIGDFGLASIPRGGGGSITSITPQATSFGGGFQGAPVTNYNFYGNVYSEREAINTIERELANRKRFGQGKI